jgi:hypothetical protein
MSSVDSLGWQIQTSLSAEHWEIEYERPGLYRVLSYEYGLPVNCTPIPGGESCGPSEALVFQEEIWTPDYDYYFRDCGNNFATCGEWSVLQGERWPPYVTNEHWLSYPESVVASIHLIDDVTLEAAEGELVHLIGQLNPSRVDRLVELPVTGPLPDTWRDEEESFYDDHPVRVDLWISVDDFTPQRMTLSGEAIPVGSSLPETTQATLEINFGRLDSLDIELPQLRIMRVISSADPGPLRELAR